jgi:hypothetical protein
MAKQKFQCRGVVRKTGQRVAVEVSADSKEAAIKIAAEHGVTVEQIALVGDVAQPPPAVQKNQPAQPRAAVPQPPRAAAPQPPKAAAPQADDVDESVDHLFDSPDDDLDDLDLGDEPDARPMSHGAQATKACPYCGEQVLAVAIKCKHCGSYLAEATQKASQPVLGPPAGRKTPRLWLAVGGAALLVVLIAVVGWALWPKGSAEPVQPVPVVTSQPAPVALPPVAKPETAKVAPEELALAAKLTLFLDSCDDMAKLVESVPKQEKFEEQAKVLNARWADVPPPKGIAWGEDAVASSKHFLELADMVRLLTAQNELIGALGQSPGNSPKVAEGYHKAAEEIRGLVIKVRALIPPACLPKPG